MKRQNNCNYKPNSKSVKFERQKAGNVDWTEYYLSKGYAETKDGTQVYAKESNNNEKLFKTDENIPQYAIKKEGNQRIEYAPKDKDSNDVWIKQGLLIRYPRNLSTDKYIFPINADTGKPDYVVDQKTGKKVYGLDANGQAIYLKDENGNPIFIEDNGNKIYAKDTQGNEIYPKNNVSDDIYKREGNAERPAKNAAEDYYYAKKANGDEYYPKIYCANNQCPDSIDLSDHLEVNFETGLIRIK